MPSKSVIRLTVNGDLHEIAVSPMETLNQVIRDGLRLTGTKRGCTSGSCGVCTINDERGQAILSCISLAVEWDGRSITTVEGVERDGKLHPLQQAFLELGAVQCGVCTPGLIMSAMGLLNTNPHPDQRAIDEALAGAICRCTGHIKVKKAVAHAIQQIAAQAATQAAGAEPHGPPA
ncbi:MAG: (2Fe-2S)-binding protein [Gammaproteobacteria bacterium]